MAFIWSVTEEVQVHSYSSIYSKKTRTNATERVTAQKMTERTELFEHLMRTGHRVVPTVATAQQAAKAYRSTASRLEGKSARRAQPGSSTRERVRSREKRSRGRDLLRTLRATSPFLAGADVHALRASAPPAGLGKLCNTSSCNASLIVRAAVQPDARTYRRCAVVHSGSSLVNAGLGACIDSMDAVLRCNDAPLISRADLGTKTTWRLSTYSPWRVVTASEKLGSGIFNATSQLLYCHTPWVGVCQQTRGAMQINPSFVGAVRDLVHGLTRRFIRAPSSGMLGVGLALALCNETAVFGSTIEQEPADAPAQCAKYFDWDEFSRLSTRWTTLSIKKRNVSQTGGKVCLTSHEYFNRDGHSWHWERVALRTLASDGAISVAGHAKL